MLRAAAKNYAGVAVLIDPTTERALELRGGGVSKRHRFALAKKAFAHTAAYDGAIANYLSSRDGAFPETLAAAAQRQGLRYGGEPRSARVLSRYACGGRRLASYRQVQGKLSYNNIADADAAWECVKSFGEPACVIVKHANPCGVAIGGAPRGVRGVSLRPGLGLRRHPRLQPRPRSWYRRSPRQQFAEVIIAPRVEPEAQKEFAPKANLRVLEVPMSHEVQAHDYKRIGGGLLVQTSDAELLDEKQLKVVTRKRPTEAQSATYCSRGAWRSSSSRTPSCSVATAPRWESAPGR